MTSLLCACGCGQPILGDSRAVLVDHVIATQWGSRDERNAEIARLHVDERMTLDAISKRFGITRERVRQIVRKQGVPATVTRNVVSEAAKAKHVPRACRGCGKVEMVPQSKARRYCSDACRAEAVRNRPPRIMAHPDGHTWVVFRGAGGRRVRLERHIAMGFVGRELDRSEWVILRDRNPSNTSLNNIAIVTPKQGMAIRDGRAKGTDFPPITQTHAQSKAA